MPPTPEQLLIQPNIPTPQEPRVQETYLPPPVVKEAEISMPDPRNWIGQIDYGMDWYGVGAQAFKVAKDMYGSILEYQVQKTTGQINDLQYDLRAKMRDSYAESFATASDKTERPETVDFNSAFTKSKPFEQHFKDKANEFIGIKDSDGNFSDVFAEDFNLDGLGSKYIDVVEIARRGLYEISQDSEKVQRDLLESYQTSYISKQTYNEWHQGGFTPDNEKTKATIRAVNNSISQGNEPLPLDQSSLQEIAKANKTNPDGNQIVIMTTDEEGQLIGYINKGVTDQEAYTALGENNFRGMATAEAQKELGARGTNTSPGVFYDTINTLGTQDPSPAQVIRLQSRLAAMSPEKLVFMFNRAGKDLDPLSQAKLAWAWTESGTNIAQRPYKSPSAFVRKLNSITTPDAELAMSLFAKINNQPSSSSALAIENVNIAQRLESSRQIMYSMLQSSGLTPDVLDANLGDIEKFLTFAQENTQIQPYIIAASVTYDTIIRSGVTDDAALEAVKMLNSLSAYADKNGMIVIPRNRSLINIFQTDEAINLRIPDRLSDGVDADFVDAWKKDTPLQRQFKTVFLNNSVEDGELPDFIESMYSHLIPALSPGEYQLDKEDVLNLLRSYSATDIQDGKHRGEGIPAGEALRVIIASHPATIKSVLGKAPLNKDEAINGAILAYMSISPADQWQWDTLYTGKNDAFINSEGGGIPFGISSIPLKNPIIDIDGSTEIVDLLKNRNIVTAPNAEFMSLENPNGRPLTYLPFSLYESGDGLSSETLMQSSKRVDRLSLGKSARKYQLLTGDSATGRDDLGVLAAGRRLTEKFDHTDDNYIAHIAERVDPEYISVLTQEVSTQEAIDAISDPRFLRMVSNLAETSSDGEIEGEEAYKISLTLMNDPLIRDAIKNKVHRRSSKLGATTKLDVAVSLMQGILGYRYNEHGLMVDPEEVKYPKQFWETVTSVTPKIKTPSENKTYLFDLRTTHENSLQNQNNNRRNILDPVHPSRTFKFNPPHIYNISTFNTILTPSEEKWFDSWKKTNAPNDSGDDYDWRGAFKSGMTPDGNGHWPDAFKKPNHPTFSSDSVYASLKPELVGTWHDKPIDKPYPEGVEIDENSGQYFVKPAASQKQISPGSVSEKPSAWLEIIKSTDGSGEGLELSSYQDTGGVWTIGFGTTEYPDGKKVKAGDVITPEQADEYSMTWVTERIIPVLSTTIPTWNKMNSNQQSAIISFAYNLGASFYQKSGFETITKALAKVENFKDVPAALALYNKGTDSKTGKKVVLGGLVKRRAKEGKLFITPLG